MSSFTTPLIVTPYGDRKWELVRSFDFYINKGVIDDLKHNIHIKKGFITDFASVPQLFWNIVPPWGKYGKAAVIHDYLYTTHDFTKAQSDMIFLHGMEILGVVWWKAHIMYIAVKYFGKKAWNKGGKRSE